MKDYKELVKLFLKERSNEVIITETFTEEIFTVYIKFKEVVFRFSSRYDSIYDKKDKAGVENITYANLYEELTMTPEMRRGRKAYLNAWMNNVINQNADARGEFVPSNKDVQEELNKLDV